ncbi:hypothetical protein RSAG8_13664, partial [Rhizoctonia solani AG-8 WAC10335]
MNHTTPPDCSQSLDQSPRQVCDNRLDSDGNHPVGSKIIMEWASATTSFSFPSFAITPHQEQHLFGGIYESILGNDGHA